MKLKRCILAALLLGSIATRAEVRFLGRGHTDLALDYDAAGKAWNVHVGSDLTGAEFAADEVILKVKPGAQTSVPSGANFAFLGSAGAPVWILPQAQNEDLLYLGYGGEDLPDGVFAGNQVNVTLQSVTGPGDFFSYRVDGLGIPQVLFNTRDGISAADVATVQAGGDAHLNWAFSQPGDYTVVLEVSGTLVEGNAVTSSGPIAFTFTVGGGPKILAEGHTDLAIDYSADADAWDVHVGSDALEEAYDADDLILQVNGEAKSTIPADDKFAFLGNAGDPVWILPQAQNEQLLYLGYGGDGLPDGIFTGNQVTVTLQSVTGPGDFFSYRVDGFGTPQVLFNTRDGIGAAAVATVQAGGDAHLNWAFTQPGDYAVVVEVSATLVEGSRAVSSGPVTYSFSVLNPVVQLAAEHVDLRVLYTAEATNPISFVARDEDHHINYSTNECVLLVNEGGKLTLPAGTPFGNEGDLLYVLPQSQNPDLLYLGISTEGIPGGVFSGNLNVRLKSVAGPGSFYVWQASSFGDFDVKMNSADGITDADQTTPLIGSHEHYNWGFTAPGVYQVTFQITGRRAGDTADLASPLTTFTFHVLPLPVESATLRIAQIAANGDLQVEVSGDAGATFSVETSSDLKAWAPLQPVTLTGSTAIVTVPVAGAKQFVRALVR
ncbi:MAG: choice-of-anchor M domain-containing protein [Verrucomicrobiae bacterium]|nr:choice-of-anchor M domain-containing protein [Verrucomicrobiae bacterium]